jgi:hypothetical protein
MVEMLGTLAIVGVLSIGGILGYSYGMDKYRANTIINDVMLRSVDLIAQKMRGGSPNLAEWQTTTAGGYTIGLENGTTGIQVDGLPKQLCQIVFDSMINNATIKVGATEYDTPSDDVCGDTNTMVFYVDDTASIKTEETTTTAEPPCEGDNCPCTSNDQCNANQYCADTNETSVHATPSMCKSLPSSDTYKILGKSYLIIRDSHSWWDAVNICSAFGKKNGVNMSLVSYEDFQNNSQSLMLALYQNVSYIDFWSSTTFDNSAYYFMVGYGNYSMEEKHLPDRSILCHIPEETQEYGNECVSNEECVKCDNGWKIFQANGTPCKASNGVSGYCSGDGECIVSSVTIR